MIYMECMQELEEICNYAWLIQSLTLQDAPQLTFGSDDMKYDFRAEWFQQPLDHFNKTSKHTFHQRYWVNSRHYKPRKGAPVIVLDGGETSGEVSPNMIQVWPHG